VKDGTPETRYLGVVGTFEHVAALRVAHYGKRIVSVDRAAAILAEEQAVEAAADREVEILYAVAGETGKHEKCLWLIRRGERTRLV
jgi:hypothetical protein